MADVNKIINEIMKEKISKWFGHVCRKKNTSIEYIVHTKDFVNPRPGGRSPKMWADEIRHDTGLHLLTAERNASDRNGWRRRNVRRAIQVK